MDGLRKLPAHRSHQQPGSGQSRSILKKTPELLSSKAAGQKPLKVFFEDEARFGRISNASRCRVPKGKRAGVKGQIIRQHTYAFSAVCPSGGDSYSIIAPECNNAAMNELLHGLSEAYPREDILRFADNAGWHKSKELVQPANIRIELLPP